MHVPNAQAALGAPLPLVSGRLHPYTGSMPENSRPAGKAPRSAVQIRATLHTIHDTAARETPPGEAAEGLDRNASLKIAAFHDRQNACDYQRKLSQAGILSSLTAERRQVAVSVDYEDHDRARLILNQHLQQSPDVKPRGARRDFDLLVFGAIAGLTVGFTLLTDSFRGLRLLTVPLTLAIAFALLGHLGDRLRLHYRRSGRLRFGLWEFVLLATLPAVALFLWKTIPQLLRS